MRAWRVADQIGNLKRYYDGYKIDHPSALAKEQSRIVSIGGTGERITPTWTIGGVTQYGATQPSPESLTWQYYCDAPIYQWAPIAAGTDPNTICNGSAPKMARIAFALDPWGYRDQSDRVGAYDKIYNARWTRLAVSLVGTGILDCAVAATPADCYTSPYVTARLRHKGPSWVPNYDGQFKLLDIPTGEIQQAMALAAETWLDPISNGFGNAYIDAVTRTEFIERPLNGYYEIELAVTPEMRLERIDRVQVLMGIQYWVKQEW